jgi:hypothetical protein
MKLLHGPGRRAGLARLDRIRSVVNPSPACLIFSSSIAEK